MHITIHNLKQYSKVYTIKADVSKKTYASEIYSII